jgi:outer membrane lipoprotein-sorting protein
MTGLPPTLERFGAELEDAARRDLGHRRTRRRLIRATAVLAVVAAGALGLLSAVTNGGGPSVVERAAAALQASDDTILHYQLNAEQQNGDGTSVSWHSETWQLLVAPYTRRQIEVGSDGTRAESVTEGDTNELYDPSNDTIYVATGAELRAANMPEIEIVSKSKLAKLTGDPDVSTAYLMRNGNGRPTVVATREGAERLRNAMARQRQRQAGTGQAPDEFRSDILKLLESGQARIVGHVDVDGRDAIRIESVDGKQVYVVDAATYDPIEWTTTGDGGGVTLRFPVYEELPVSSESMDLLSLEAQHPGAQVVRGAAGYTAAEKRLYPHG